MSYFYEKNDKHIAFWLVRKTDIIWIIEIKVRKTKRNWELYMKFTKIKIDVTQNRNEANHYFTLFSN